MLTRKRLNIQFDEDFDERIPEQIRDVRQEILQDLTYESPEEEGQEDNVLPFSRTINGLLYVYGGQENEEVVMQLHLQLQEMISIIFSREILMQLIKLSKRKPTAHDLYVLSEEDQPEDQQLVISNSQKFRTIFRKFLSTVFKEFRGSFQMVDRHLVKVNKKFYDEKAIDRTLVRENLYKSAIKRKQQEYNKVTQSESEPSIFDQQSFKSDQLSTPQDESDLENVSSEKSDAPDLVQQPEIMNWEQILHDRIERMNLREFDRFMSLRSKTFISKKPKRLVEFLDPHEHGYAFKKALRHEIRFINYCFCRVVRAVVVLCFEGKGADYRMTKTDVTEHGNRIIKRYMDRAKKFSLTRTKVQAMAFKVFAKEYVSQGFFQLENKRFKLKKKSDESVTVDPNLPENEIIGVWRSLSFESRRMWIDRVQAEKHLKDVVLKKRNPRPPNKYFEYLWNRFLQQKSSLGSCEQLMKRWFKEWYIGIGR